MTRKTKKKTKSKEVIRITLRLDARYFELAKKAAEFYNLDDFHAYHRRLVKIDIKKLIADGNINDTTPEK